MSSLRGCSEASDAKPAPFPPPLPPPAPEDTKNKVQNHPKSFHKNILHHKMNAKQDQKYDLAQEIEARLESIILKDQSVENDVFSSAVAIYSTFDSSFAPLLQNGPMCGLVALAMAGYLTDLQCSEDQVEKLLTRSINEGYSKQGEMFSCENMRSLALSHFGEKCDISLVSTLDESFQRKLVEGILQGGIFLFPYDADFNHSPSKRNGQGAHWAIIHGVLLFHRQSESLECFIERTNQNCVRNMTRLGDESESGGNYCKCIYLNQGFSTIEPTLLANLLDKLDDFTIYLTANQGKSLHLGLWTIQDLLESNQNLLEISPKIVKDHQNYLTFDIKKDLCSKAIFIMRKVL